MTTTNNIRSYATTDHIPTSGQARISFWTGLISFPLLILLSLTGRLTAFDRLPTTKTDVLFFCFQMFLVYISPLCALIYGISAIIRIGLSRSIIEGTALAWAGIVLGVAYFLVAWPE